MLKLVNPSWWRYYIRHRNVPLFWWRYMMTRPFPSDFESTEDLIRFGEQHKVWGFNAECIRSYIFWQIHQKFRCTSFAETGTLYGHTSAFVNKVFKSPIFTCEINPTYQKISLLNLLWLNNIKRFRCDSVEFLKLICDESVIGKNPIFYLDAHWYDYMPLPDELATIADQCKRAIVLIDDFMVPKQPNFLYDEYPGTRIDMKLLDTHLRSRRQDISTYLPNYQPDLDPTGKGIGYAVVLMGQDQDLPGQTFPFELLSKV